VQHFVIISNNSTLAVYIVQISSLGLDIATFGTVVTEISVLSQVSDLELTPVTDARDTPVVIHGTSKKAWDTIQHEVSVHFYISCTEY